MLGLSLNFYLSIYLSVCLSLSHRRKKCSATSVFSHHSATAPHPHSRPTKSLPWPGGIDTLGFLDFVFSFLHIVPGTLAICPSLTKPGPPPAQGLSLSGLSLLKKCPRHAQGFLPRSIQFRAKRPALATHLQMRMPFFPLSFPCFLLLPTPDIYFFIVFLRPHWHGSFWGQKACSLYICPQGLACESAHCTSAD